MAHIHQIDCLTGEVTMIEIEEVVIEEAILEAAPE